MLIENAPEIAGTYSPEAELLVKFGPQIATFLKQSGVPVGKTLGWATTQALQYIREIIKENLISRAWDKLFKEDWINECEKTYKACNSINKEGENGFYGPYLIFLPKKISGYIGNIRLL